MRINMFAALTTSITASLLLSACGSTTDKNDASQAISQTTTTSLASTSIAPASCKVVIDDPSYLPNSNYRAEFQDKCNLAKFDRGLVGMEFATQASLNLRFENAANICYSLGSGKTYSQVLGNTFSTNPKTFVSLTVTIFCPEHTNALPR